MKENNEITVSMVANGYILKECPLRHDCDATPDGTHVFESLDALHKWMFVHFHLDGDNPTHSR